MPKFIEKNTDDFGPDREQKFADIELQIEKLQNAVGNEMN